MASSNRRIASYRLRAARYSLKLTQAEFGRMVDVHPMTVSQWERGESEPNLDSMLRVVEITSQPMEWFFLPND